MGITHQEGITKILFNLLQMDEELIEILSRSNPFDNLLRSYSEHNSKGEYLYRNRKGINHYKFSVNAYKHFKQYGKMEGLHSEHIVPLRVIKAELLKKKFTSIRSLSNYLQKTNFIIVITKAEQKLMDSKFRIDLPMNGLNRFDYFELKIAPQTEKNTLICKD
jgi:hypothetical protein